MPGISDRLKKLFGWDSRHPPVRTSKRDDAFAAQQSRSPADRYHDEMGFDQQKRQDRYDVYDAMDVMSDVASVLDAYAEDSTQIDHEEEKSVWIESNNKKVKVEGERLLHDVLNVEDWIEGNARDTGKYGDDFARIRYTAKDGITSLFWRDPRDVERIENQDGILIGYEEVAKLKEYRRKVTADLNKGGDGSSIEPTYKPWDILHFRIYKKKRLPREKWPNIYGTSLLSGSERIAKQVKILDDLLMIMRITRSLDRKTYFVDVGRSPVEEEVRILKRWRRALKRKTYVDPSLGRFDSRFDPYAWTEDEFWPVKEGTNSRVETQQGITDIKEIADIDHFRDKFYGSMRAPKAYFGFEGDINAKATLSSQSLKWARAAQTLQRAVRQGLKRLCQIHFAIRGIEVNAKDFEVMMMQPSLVELLDKLEAWSAVIDVAERMATLGETLQLDRYDWTVYILEHVLWLTKQDAKKFTRKIPKEDQPPPPEQLQGRPLEKPPQLPPGQEKPTGEPPETPPKPPEKAPPGKESIFSIPSNGNGRRAHLAEIDHVIKTVAARMGLQQPTEGADPRELPPFMLDREPSD
jgi:hypothetical protein